MITPGQALWITGNLPKVPPDSSIMPSTWQERRRQVIIALQEIVDAEHSVQGTAGYVPPNFEEETKRLVARTMERVNRPRRR